MKKIAIGSDHAGFQMKEKIRKLLAAEKIEVVDYGTKDEESVDYPDFAEKVSTAVAGGTVDSGILICGTGIGMSITANKFAGVRAALVHDSFEAKMSREHNDANILIVGSRTLPQEKLPEIVKTWLSTPFEGGRHTRRIDKIRQIEEKQSRKEKS